MEFKTRLIAISEIKELIKEKYLDHKVISISALKEKYVGFTRKHLKGHDGFSIWGSFSVKFKVVCFYTQDSKARIMFYDPENQTLTNSKL